MPTTDDRVSAVEPRTRADVMMMRGPTHYVRDIYDFTGGPDGTALCVLAGDGTVGWGEWYTATRRKVTCRTCLEWLHA